MTGSLPHESEPVAVGDEFEQAVPPPGYRPYRLTVRELRMRPANPPQPWALCRRSTDRRQGELHPVQVSSLLNPALYRRLPASSAGSQEPNPAAGSVGTDAAGASEVGSQEPAPAERDERTWTLTRTCYGGLWVTSAHGPMPNFRESVEVVPRSERDYWRQAYEDADRSLKEWTVRGGLARVQEQLDQARAALKERQDAIDKAISLLRSSAYVGGPSEREAFRGTEDALGPFATQHVAQGAAGVTEKEGGTHG